MSVREASVDFGHRRGPRALIVPDHCSRDGADCIALAIESYWSVRGFAVSLRVDPVRERIASEGNMPRCYQVRSDMINGWPRK